MSIAIKLKSLEAFRRDPKHIQYGTVSKMAEVCTNILRAVEASSTTGKAEPFDKINKNITFVSKIFNDKRSPLINKKVERDFTSSDLEKIYHLLAECINEIRLITINADPLSGIPSYDKNRILSTISRDIDVLTLGKRLS